MMTFRKRLFPAVRETIGAAVRGLALLAALGAAPATAQAPPPPVPAPDRQAETLGHIYVFRGFADIFSIGMNDLALKLFNGGYEVTLGSYTDWAPTAEQALQRYRADPARARIAIVGHSFGANASLAMAAWLGLQGVPVDLLVTYDPTFALIAVTSNVKRTLNFYAGPPLGYALVSWPGAPVQNIDRTELSHVEVAKASDLHDRTIAAIVEAFAPRPAAPLAP